MIMELEGSSAATFRGRGQGRTTEWDSGTVGIELQDWINVKTHLDCKQLHLVDNSIWFVYQIPRLSTEEEKEEENRFWTISIIYQPQLKMNFFFVSCSKG